MNWTWTWEAVVAVVSVAISIGAVLTAWRANRLVGVYKRALWTLERTEPTNGGNVAIRLTNVGESPARDVVLTLDVDPLHMWSAATPIPLIPAKSSDVVALRIPPSDRFPGSDVDGMWLDFFSKNDGMARAAMIGWTDLEGRRRRTPTRIPVSWDTGL